MKTTKLYENNTYLRACIATVQEVADEHTSTESGEQMCRRSMGKYTIL